MKLVVTDLVWVDERAECSLDELAERSRLPAVLAAAQTAARLRRDFELDMGGVALALALLRRINEVETQVQRLGAVPSRSGA